MVFNTKQELYNYLNNFDYESHKDSSMSSVYFLVKYGKTIEPIYFTPYEDVWFESPCEVRGFPMKDDEVMKYVRTQYGSKYWKEAHEFETLMQKDGTHYDIDCPQCSPFLPEKVEIIKPLSERECLEWILENWAKDKKDKEKNYNG